MSSVGVDTGGTFTDLVCLRDDGTLEVSKRPSTPPDFSDGILNVVESIDDGSVLEKIDYFYHGTTVTTNAMITGTGAKIAFLTTAGFRDTLPTMRIIGRSAGKSETELKQYTYTNKPEPIVAKPLIKEIHERVDRNGDVIVPLDEEAARAAIRDVVDEGVEAIGICLLWSFMNESHERRLKELVEEEAPGLHVSISSEIVPAIKEYERSSTTAVNAYLAPLLTNYLKQLQSRLTEAGLKGSLFVMQSMGGAMRIKDGDRRAANTLVSGPAGGVVAARFLGRRSGHENIICADVGGTSFDVGLIVDGEPVVTSSSTVSQHTLLVPTIDIVSIGAGGGSIAWVDLGRLRVGPQSGGADPGPACYGKGGTEPTVTDADVVLGYIDPDYFLGGKLELDRELAEKAIKEKIADPLGMSVQDAAAGIVEIANHHMSDLMRKMTVERGYDPRDFVVYGFGGAGPLHGGAFGRELGAKEILFPLGNVSSTFSALGLTVSDLSTVTQVSDLTSAPFDPAWITERFVELEAEAVENLRGASVADQEIKLQRILELRYRGQVHQIDTPVPGGNLDEVQLAQALDDFEQRYEDLYGRGSAFREAGIELTTFRVHGTAPIQAADLKPFDLGDSDASSVRVDRKKIYWREAGGLVDTDIYGEGLLPGMEFEGPAVIRMEATTALVHPGQRARIDEFGSVRVSFS